MTTSPFVVDTEFYWFVGLFEGEGTFRLTEDSTKGLRITMTDLDVLERAQRLLGGTIVARKEPRNPKWKPAWYWSLPSRKTREIVPFMIPLLGSRRASKAREYMKLDDQIKGRQAEKLSKNETLRERVRELKVEGLSDIKVGEQLGISRQYVYRLNKPQRKS